MKFLWITDIHLNFVSLDKRKQFYRGLKDTDAIVISGDIAEAPSITKILSEVADHVGKPIYFVLGNHDYYHGEINNIRDAMQILTQENPYLFWLGCSEPIRLDSDTMLVGEDGWADGRYGNYANTQVSLNDSWLILDLSQERILGRYKLLEKMQQLADQDATALYSKLIISASEDVKKIIVVTHVPPFKETALYQGKMSSDDFLPFFASKATGDVLIEFAKNNISTEILVLCGHSHDACTYHPLDNLTVLVGNAEYGRPHVQGIIRTDTLDFDY